MRWFVPVSIAVVVTGLAAVAYYARRHDSTTPGKKRGDNVQHALSAFVGTETCAQCHPDKVAEVARTGHARTFFHTVDSTLARSLDGESYFDQERQLTFRYEYDADGLWTTIPERFGGERFPLQYALGSGENAVTFLTLIPRRVGGTAGIEHRVSWFADTSELGLTPGHRGLPAEQEVEFFGRVTLDDKLTRCIECHTTTARIDGEEVVDLRPGVSCESCHGAGRQHVEQMEHDQPAGRAISGFGARTALEEIRVCGNCHRLPEMVEPGELQRQNFKIVRFQPVGLLESRCYQESEGRLRCTTCHDPHQPASQLNRAGYEKKCLACHTPPRGAACPVSPAEKCIDCHMPAVDVHEGMIPFHDHWIRVRKDDDPPAVGAAQPN